jgi:hypothetical protein
MRLVKFVPEIGRLDMTFPATPNIALQTSATAGGCHPGACRGSMSGRLRLGRTDFSVRQKLVRFSCLS